MIVSLDDALELVHDGDTVAIGGAVLSRKPMAAVRALAASRRRDLELVTFAGSLEVERLLAAGALRAVRSSYVGMGSHGPAPRFTAAVAAGEIDDLEESEWMLLGRLRAAAAGMPFIVTRAGMGSDLVAARGLREVADPYTDERLLAIPALTPGCGDRPRLEVRPAWQHSDVVATRSPRRCRSAVGARGKTRDRNRGAGRCAAGRGSERPRHRALPIRGRCRGRRRARRHSNRPAAVLRARCGSSGRGAT